MTEQGKSIKDTLNVIRKALEDESSSQDSDNDVLILNKLVKDDGTISVLNDRNLHKDEIKDILNKKVTEIFSKHFDKWLDKNMPNYLDKYYKKK